MAAKPDVQERIAAALESIAKSLEWFRSKEGERATREHWKRIKEETSAKK